MSDVGSTPQLEAPALAELVRSFYLRPAWQMRDGVPLAVDPDTFERAYAEMQEVQARYGRPVPVAPWLKEQNFLLQGIPVVKTAPHT